MARTPTFVLLLVVAGGAALAAFRLTTPAPTGPYLGQQPPGPTPSLFAPGIVSTGLTERDLAITPDGREIYWTVSVPGSSLTTIIVSRLADGQWSVPAVAPHMGDPSAMHIEPAISPDGRRFFFTRATPAGGGGGRITASSIWVMEREGDAWGAPRDLGAPINGEGNQFFPSVTRDGTLYFTREGASTPDGIYRSRLVDGRYTPPQRLPPAVNGGTERFNAFVDPGERFLIVPMAGRPDSLGGVDYYLVVRRPDDSWREPINLGPAVNTPGSGEYSPYVSPDGRYLFFMSSRLPRSSVPPSLTYGFFETLLRRPQNGGADIYWMEAAFLENLGK